MKAFELVFKWNRAPFKEKLEMLSGIEELPQPIAKFRVVSWWNELPVDVQEFLLAKHAAPSFDGVGTAAEDQAISEAVEPSASDIEAMYDRYGERRCLMICPICKRDIPSSVVGKNLKGEKLLCWHLNGKKECAGSFHSVSRAEKLAVRR
jgi:hypothetical protein